MSALSFIWIMIYAPQQCSHFPPTMRLIWGAPGPWSTVSLQYGVLQIFIILKPPNMSNYSAFKPTGGTSTGTRHHHHPSPSRATLARKYQGSHSALIRVDLNLGVWTYSWWWLRVADIVRYGLLHWLILVAQSAAHNIWLYTLDAEVTKLFEAACCQSVCLRPIWQLHPRVSCPHQLNIGVNTEHVWHVTLLAPAPMTGDWRREARGRVAQQERNTFFKAELKIISLISCCAGKWCEALWGNHTMLCYQGSSRLASLCCNHCCWQN